MKYICPEDKVELIKNKIIYGHIPSPSESGSEDYAKLKNVIFAGCIMPSNPHKIGYKCPKCGEVFVLDDRGKLKNIDDVF